MTITKNIIVSGSHKKPILTDVYYNNNHKQKPVVIFCHGYKGFKDWGAWDLMAKAFAQNNFFFIKFNFSHNGGTIEQPIDFPDLEAFGNNNYTKELDDLSSVINWIHSEPRFKENINLDKVTLIGHSRAGGIVTIKAEEDSRVTKVISLAGVCDFGKRTATIGDLEDWKKQGVKYVLNGRTKQQMPHFYQFYEDYKNNEERLNIKRAVSNLQTPYLIIHGNQDTSVLIDEAKNLHEWQPQSKFIVIDGANHVFGASHPWTKEELPAQLNEAIKTILAFLIQS
ncbi:alpha/beta hydrolase family protein [Cognatitamlana onchidii]|uniref:alpha/beta hydrolase family protein n=1 Tax=Cognatitamlana onchidii TaxID=2562860 RepID=UPI0010A65DBA|nr:alpha/beta fold hydrolase [Algibacter onchidii]